MEKLTTECQLVIGYIIRKTNEYNINKSDFEQVPLTIKRIQKLLYLIQVESIKHHGTHIFEDDFYALPGGPVIPGVYDLYLDYTTKGSFPVKLPQGSLNKEEQLLIDYILESTNDINNHELINQVRNMDNLWLNAYNLNGKEIITKNMMYNCYSIKKVKTKKLDTIRTSNKNGVNI